MSTVSVPGRRLSALVLLAGLFAGSAAAPVAGQMPAGIAHRFRDVTIAPDGRTVAWIGPTGGAAGENGLVLVDPAKGLASAQTVSVPDAAPGTITDLSWARDGNAIVFAASTGDGTPGIYLAPRTGEAARLVAKVPGSIQSPILSPDGRTIAGLYAPPAEEANGPTAAAPRDTGVISNIVDHQHLALIDVASGALRVVSPADLYVFEAQWSPTGTELLATAVEGSGNNNWYSARLVAITPDGQVRDVARPTVQIADPQWSPDGSQVAFIGGLMSDEGVTGGDVYIVPSRGGEARNLTPALPVSAATITWTGPHTLLMTAWARGGSEVASVDAMTGRVTPILDTDDAVSTGGYLPSVAVAQGGTAAALVRESLAKPPEVWVGPLSGPVQLTHVNDGIHAAWGKAERVTWHNGAVAVEGILVAPTDVVAGKRYPMIVDVHGGPAAAERPFWMYPGSLHAQLSRAGYFVFMPNPRGSYGQGEAFTRGNVKDLGYGDLRDILTGIDSAARRFPIDTTRLGITGGSYGGFMTMWAVTQTRRFRAAVSVAGLSNWLSYAGENGINRWMLAYFGDKTVYDDPAIYARSAPMHFINQARTPTLIVAGERDTECPAPQSFEFWRGLQHAGAPAELIVYADEGHGIRQSAHARDLMQRTLAWFDRYLASGGPGVTGSR
jgi:dipeptidyl aminopeptidase/acylaminoacyl peptidase